MLTVILASVFAAQTAIVADDVVFKVDDQSVIAPDATAARYVVAMCRSLKVGIYRVEPLDDGAFKMTCRNGFLSWSSGLPRVLDGYWNGVAIVVPADKVIEKGYRSERFAWSGVGGIFVIADQDDVHDVLFDVMAQARRPYQIGPNVRGIVTLSLEHKSIESLVAFLLAQVGALLLIDQDDIVAINDPGIIDKKGRIYRSSDPIRT